MSVEIVGANRVINRLAQIGNAIEPATAKNILETAEKMKVHAKAIVPIDTGSLKKSIRIHRYAKTKGLIQTTGVTAGGYVVNHKTGRLVNYAEAVEYGTSKQKAQPFMRPAFEKYKHEIPKKIKRKL